MPCCWIILLITSFILRVFNSGATSKGEIRTFLMASTTVCKTIPSMTKEQLELCHQYPDVTMAAVHGLQLAVEECQHQFQLHRWNCSSLNKKSSNPHSSVILQKGYRESAFAYAISSAGVAYSVARACGLGHLTACGCDYHYGRRTRHRASSKWKWGGCSHNLDFGVEFSKAFLDSREKAGDIQSRINLHNNRAGRLALSTNMQVKCKCHGMSGSCELKTCWKAAPDFRTVGKFLKEKYSAAVLVDQTNLGNGSPLLPSPKNRRRRPRLRTRPRQRRKIHPTKKREMELSLLYYERSPNYCEKDSSADFPGTFGRQCNRTSKNLDGCSSLCCGRGYNLLRQKRNERCNCRFHWCCTVECQNCTVDEWITVCK